MDLRSGAFGPERVRIQEACDELYCDPDDEVAARQLRELLGRAEASTTGVGNSSGNMAVSRASWRRLVRIACDELYDDPDDHDARDRLVLLLDADGGLAA